MMGYDPQPLPLAVPKSELPSVEQRLSNLIKSREEAIASHELARQTMKQRITRSFTPFKKGDKVWLEAKNLNLGYDSKKLSPKRQGPFVISEVLGPVTYHLILPKQWKVHPIFHAHLLTPYHENEEHGPNFPSPPPDIIE